MTPRLINGDCLVEMDKLIKEGVKVDAIITDPPYGTTACKWDQIIPFDAMWERLNKLIKKNGAVVLFGSEPFSSLLRVSNLKCFKYDWIWKKTRSTGNLNACKMPMKNHEVISIFNCVYRYYPQKTQAPLYMVDTRVNIKPSDVKKGGCYNNSKAFENVRKKDDGTRHPTTVIEFPNPNNNSQHPTAKPVKLIEYLIKTYTNKNELVLDFTMGSGTCGVACHNTDRDFIGIELDDQYFEIASNRIYENSRQQKLF